MDGTDIKKMDPQILRSIISVVSQDAPLFGRTVFENISYGSNAYDVSQDAVVAAAKAANAHEFIMSFPDGYSTLVGERGRH